MALARRKSKNISLRPIFYFAVEGACTEVDYLQNLQRIYNVVFKPIPYSHRDPRHLRDAMKRFIKRGSSTLDDYFLIMSDRDAWELSEIKISWEWANEDPSRRFFIFSNPCFELWLLRHYESGSGASTYEICHRRLSGCTSLLTGKSIPRDLFSWEDIQKACQFSKKHRDWKRPGFTNVHTLIDLLDKKYRAI